MTAEVMDVALSGAKASLDPQERIWLLGVAHLTGVPIGREFSDDQVRQIIAMGQELSDFPSGPVRYIRDGYEQEAPDTYRMVSLSHPSAPHLQMKLGLGIAGFVAVGLTRSGLFEDGQHVPSGVLLSDMESVIADTYTLAVTSAIQLRYTGAIDLAFAVSDSGPGATPAFYHVDGEDGRLRCTATLSAPLATLRHRLELTAESTGESVHDDLYSVARRFARSVGSGRCRTGATVGLHRRDLRAGRSAADRARPSRRRRRPRRRLTRGDSHPRARAPG